MGKVWAFVAALGIVGLVVMYGFSVYERTHPDAWRTPGGNTPAMQCPMAAKGMPKPGCPCPMCQAMMRGEAMPAMPPMAMSAPATRIPLIGEQAPAFKGTTTQGPIDFPKDFEGKWVILFSHPADFTPVCTTEFMTFATMASEFHALNCELVGISIDSNFSHIAWLLTIKDKIDYKGMKGVVVKFPVVADVKMDVAMKYGMIQPEASDTQAVRAVFIIDPTAKIRALLYYPLTNGRNIDEIKRLLIALQTTDAHKVSTPANWQPGDDVIVPPPGSCGTAMARVANPGEGVTCLDWFLCFKKLPKDQITPPVEK